METESLVACAVEGVLKPARVSIKDLSFESKLFWREATDMVDEMHKLAAAVNTHGLPERPALPPQAAKLRAEMSQDE